MLLRRRQRLRLSANMYKKVVGVRNLAYPTQVKRIIQSFPDRNIHCSYFGHSSLYLTCSGITGQALVIFVSPIGWLSNIVLDSMYIPFSRGDVCLYMQRYSYSMVETPNL